MERFTIHNRELLWEELIKIEERIRTCGLEASVRVVKAIAQNDIEISKTNLEEWFASKAALENKIVKLSQETIKALDAAASLLLNNLHPADTNEDK